MKTTTSWLSRCSLVWEIPLAAVSFCFYHTARPVMHALRKAHFRKRLSLEWIPLSEILTKPLALPTVMVTGPRWNTHALIASAGPFTVDHRLLLDVETANRSAESWTLVLYSAADLRTVIAISRHTVDAADWHDIKLDPGRYCAIARYYGWREQPMLPSLRTDTDQTVPQRVFSPRENDYLDHLRARESLGYLALHYYIHVLLRFRHRLPAAWVKKEVLPVGNPDTHFRYGAYGPSQHLCVTVQPEVLAGFQLFLTLYDRASFPVQWYEIDGTRHESPPTATAGFYLLRVHPRPIGESRTIPTEGILIDVM